MDEIRGFAIICMVIYHTMFQLKYNFEVDVPLFFEDWFDIIRDIFAGAFIFISGIMCRYSRNNIKRGVKCFLLGMLITFVVPFFSEYGLTFGILHLLGISMMIYGIFEAPLEHLPAFAGALIFAAVAAFTWNAQYGYLGLGDFKISFSEKISNMTDLYPLGIITKDYRSNDFFPIMPWFFVFMCGTSVGYWFKNGSMPKCFYKSHCKWLAATGRITIWIYLFHLPVILTILSLIFR